MGIGERLRSIRRLRRERSERFKHDLRHFFRPGWLDNKDDPELRAAMEKAGIALIHVPKAAGNSVAEKLYGHSPSHRSWRWYQGMSVPTIAVIREPISRFLSAFDFLSSGGIRSNDFWMGQLFVPNDVNRCVERIVRDGVLANYYHFRKQSWFVADETILMVDEIVALENLDQRFPGLKRQNVTKGLRTPTSELTEESIAALERHYAIDFALHRMASTHLTSAKGLQIEIK